MLDHNQFGLITAELNPELLTQPFQVQTHWYVITGAACTGKTTLIDSLAGKGYPVIPESARDYFDAEIARGRTLAEIRRDDAFLQHEIANLQLKYERSFPPAKVTFLDRAIPDSLTFFRIFGLDPHEILPECFHIRYQGVFILDRLPLHRTKTLGPEDDAASDFLDQWLERDYRSLGYAVTRVPVMPPEARLAFILERVTKSGVYFSSPT